MTLQYRIRLGLAYFGGRMSPLPPLSPAPATMRNFGLGDGYQSMRASIAPLLGAEQPRNVVHLGGDLTVANVRLLLDVDGNDLLIQLLSGENNIVADELRVEDHFSVAGIDAVSFAADPSTVWEGIELSAASPLLINVQKGLKAKGREIILGGNLDDALYGEGAGVDVLRGRGGDDVYYLGRGVGKDIIEEGQGEGRTGGDVGDSIRLLDGIARSDVRLRRNNNGRDLFVEILSGGEVTDSVRIKEQYVDDKARVDYLVFANGEIWQGDVLDNAAIRGNKNNNNLDGLDDYDDVFDGDLGGNDVYFGRGGSDVYWLGTSTDMDTVKEYKSNDGAGDEDVVKVRSSIAGYRVWLRRSADGRSLYVQLADDVGLISNQLKIDRHYSDASAQVEKVVLDNGDELDINALNKASLFSERNGDTLRGRDNLDDYLDGEGGGDNILSGGGGADTYYFGRGMGADRILDEIGDNRILVKAGVDKNSLRLTRGLARAADGVEWVFGDDLVVELAAENGGALSSSLRVGGFFGNGGDKITGVHFQDETVWDVAGITAMARVRGDDGDNVIVGSEGNDIFDGDAGGNDTFKGGGGGDVYYLGRGAGHDSFLDSVGDNVIRIKSGIAPSSVRINYNVRGDFMLELLAADGRVTDSLRAVDFGLSAPMGKKTTIARVEIENENGEANTLWTGGELSLTQHAGTYDFSRIIHRKVIGAGNVFAEWSMEGKNIYHGFDGDDLYYLGRGMGHDEIYDSGGNDAIRVQAGIDQSRVRLNRVDGRFVVELLDAGGRVTDSLRLGGAAAIEWLEFESAPGHIQSAARITAELGAVRDGSTPAADAGGNNVFDSADGVGRVLNGGAGNDLYYLGRGTGHDQIMDSAGNDVVRIKSGIEEDHVRVARTGEYWKVELLNNDGLVTDSLRVGGGGKIERIEFEGGDGKIIAADTVSANGVWNRAGEGVQTFNNTQVGRLSTDEVLAGRAGNDVYYLARGVGSDLIIDTGGVDIVRVDSAVGRANVRLDKNGRDLIVAILGENGAYSDRLTVRNHFSSTAARIERVEFETSEGGVGGETLTQADFSALRVSGNSIFPYFYLNGTDGDDVFDEDSPPSGHGGHSLFGLAGDDTYYLGRNTGYDRIYELGGDDVIRIKSGAAAESVRLYRKSGADRGALVVEYWRGEEVDALEVDDFYRHAHFKIERVEFEDAAITKFWSSAELNGLRIQGGADAGNVDGGAGNDEIDGINGVAGATAYNNTLRGGDGDDVYYLGFGGGDDIVSDTVGDNRIRIKNGVAKSDVRLNRTGDSLAVEIMRAGAATDKLIVADYFIAGAGSKIVAVEFEAPGIAATFGAEEFNRATVIYGDAGDNILQGGAGASVFDSDSDSDDRDTLQGGVGGDTYRFGAGIGRDTIIDAGGVDTVLVKAGITESMLRFNRDGDKLIIEHVVDGGLAGGGLAVTDHYRGPAAALERIEFAGGGVLTAAEFEKRVRRYGSNGNDIIDGGGGADVFDSIGGNDTVNGGAGDDTYFLGIGSGKDVVNDTAGTDTVIVKMGIAVGDVRFNKKGADLAIEIVNDVGVVDDSLLVKGHFTPGRMVERIDFRDDEADTFRSLSNRDFRLYGDAADNVLRGGAGDDVFDGSAGGDDTLVDPGGNDVYYLGWSTGRDIVEDRGGNMDTVKIKAGISSELVRVNRMGGDVVFELVQMDGVVAASLRVNGQFINDDRGMEKVSFIDGVDWSDTKFSRSVRRYGTAAAEDIHGTGGDDVFDGSAGGADNLIDVLGNDIYYLGRGTGADTVRDSDGVDKIIVKQGADKGQILLKREGADLIVEMTPMDGETNSLRVLNHFLDGGNYAVERVEFEGVYGDWVLGDMANFGDDSYRLNYGLGALTVVDGGGGDEIRVAAGISKSSVRFNRYGRDGRHLAVELLNDAGEVSDSVKIENYFAAATFKIEKIVFEDDVDTPWYAADMESRMRFYGTDGDDVVDGTDGADIFDAVGGNSFLDGGDGGDIYYLGRGTGRDEVNEESEDGGDDVVRIKAGIAPGNVRLRRSHDALYVKILSEEGKVTDELIIDEHFVGDTPRLERLEFVSDDGGIGEVWGDEAFKAINAIPGAAWRRVVKGGSGADVFDKLATERHRAILLGGAGDDVYVLETGGGYNVIYDKEGANIIRLGRGVSRSSVRLNRVADNLIVELMCADGSAMDNFVVKDYYAERDSSRISRVEFLDDEDWDLEALDLLRIGASGGDSGNGRVASLRQPGPMTGTAGNDVFDSMGGNDELTGNGGSDIFYLGRGTGHDTVTDLARPASRRLFSSYGASSPYVPDADDVVRIKNDVSQGDVRLRDTLLGDTVVEIFNIVDGEIVVSDSLTIKGGRFFDPPFLVEFEQEDGSVREVWGGEEKAWIHIPCCEYMSDYAKTDSVYTLGVGSGDINIVDAGGADTVRIAAGIAESSVIIDRDGYDLMINIMGAGGESTDSLRVIGHFVGKSLGYALEKVEFLRDDGSVGTVWTEEDFDSAKILGITGLRFNRYIVPKHYSGDLLYGTEDEDVFDTDSDNHLMNGFDDDDVYYLGANSGRDSIVDYKGDEDRIRIKADVDKNFLRLYRSSPDDGMEIRFYKPNFRDIASRINFRYDYLSRAPEIEILEFENAAGEIYKSWDNVLQAVGEANRYKQYTVEEGTDAADYFVGAAGHHIILGMGGADTYYLGASSGHDIIVDSSGVNIIRINSDVDATAVHLDRSEYDLVVQVRGARGISSSTMTVRNYYRDGGSTVDRVEFLAADGAVGTVWNSDRFEGLNIRGDGKRNDLHGTVGADIFDSDQGSHIPTFGDDLYGKGGADVYYLGFGTGKGNIHEYHQNVDDAPGDMIRVKDGISVSQVKLSDARLPLRPHLGLKVSLLDADGAETGDSLTMYDPYNKKPVESIHVGNKVLLSSQYENLIAEMADFDGGVSEFETKTALLDHFWRDVDTLSDMSA